jgi:magnesium transporter
MRERLDRLYSHIESLLQEHRFPETKEALSTMEPADISEMLVGTPRAKMVLIFRLLPKDLAIEVFEHMEGSEREDLLASFTEKEAAEIIEEMSDDDRTALLDELLLSWTGSVTSREWSTLRTSSLPSPRRSYRT